MRIPESCSNILPSQGFGKNLDPVTVPGSRRVSDMSVSLGSRLDLAGHNPALADANAFPFLK